MRFFVIRYHGSELVRSFSLGVRFGVGMVIDILFLCMLYPILKPNAHFARKP